MRARLTVLLAVLSVVGVASAQEVQPVPRGARVRITTEDPSPIIVGQLIGVSDSTVLVRRQRGGGDIEIPRSLVMRLEVSRGTSRARSAGRGALFGLVFGSLIGFGWGEAIDCAGAYWCFTGPWAAALGATTGVTAGTILGLVVGSFERWRDTDVPASLSIVPASNGSLAIVSRIPF